MLDVADQEPPAVASIRCHEHLGGPFDLPQQFQFSTDMVPHRHKGAHDRLDLLLKIQPRKVETQHAGDATQARLAFRVGAETGGQALPVVAFLGDAPPEGIGVFASRFDPSGSEGLPVEPVQDGLGVVGGRAGRVGKRKW